MHHKPLVMNSMSAELLQLNCPQCGGQSSFGPEEQKVECRFCGHTSLLVPKLNAAPPPAENSETRTRTIWSKPDQVKFSYEGGRVNLSYRWFHPAILGLLFFCVFWDGFLLLWYGAVFNMSDNNSMSMIAILFPLGHVSVGVALTYFVVASFLNSTHISLDSETFTIQHTPLPWPGNRSVARTDVVQFFVSEKRGSKGGVSYQLNAQLRSGTRVKIAGGLMNPELGFYLEQQLEKWGKIPDRPVAGEAQV